MSGLFFILFFFYFFSFLNEISCKKLFWSSICKWTQLPNYSLSIVTRRRNADIFHKHPAFNNRWNILFSHLARYEHIQLYMNFDLGVLSPPQRCCCVFQTLVYFFLPFFGVYKNKLCHLIMHGPISEQTNVITAINSSKKNAMDAHSDGEEEEECT